MPTIKGTASVTDSRARQKALKKTKFPKHFFTPVSLEKVNIPVLTQWVEQKITSILGFEDEIVSFTAINLFLPSDNESLDPRKAQLDLAGFLGDQAAIFSAELWKLMLEAQASAHGIPQTLLEQKKKEMITVTIARNEECQDQGDKNVSADALPTLNHLLGIGKNRVENVIHRSPQFHSHRTQANLSGQGSFIKYSNASNKDTTPLCHPQHLHRDTTKTLQKVSSVKTFDQDLDEFGRIDSTQRSKNLLRHAPSIQYDHNREAFRRSRLKSRRRERDDDNRDKELDHRRRSNSRYREKNDDTRQLGNRRGDSNHRDDYFDHDRHKYCRHQNDYSDHHRYRDEEGSRNRHHDFDRDIDNLERRLAQLKKHFSGHEKNNDYRTMYRLDKEMKGVEDRIKELNWRKRAYNFPRNGYCHIQGHYSRSTDREYRRGGRRKRSNSTSSDRSNLSQSGRHGYSIDRTATYRRSRESCRFSPEQIKKNRSSRKRLRRRRSDSYSNSEE